LREMQSAEEEHMAYMEGYRDAMEAFRAGEEALPKWRHKKRGTAYTEVGRGFASISQMPIEDHTAVVIYRGEDGILWVRNAVEFDDGRFEELRR
jgi:hypothetical protein